MECLQTPSALGLQGGKLPPCDSYRLRAAVCLGQLLSQGCRVSEGCINRTKNGCLLHVELEALRLKIEKLSLVVEIG